MRNPETYTKVDLNRLIDQMEGNSDVVEELVLFVLLESEELWHGRARAKICRRLKNINISADNQALLVTVITKRF